MGFFTWAFLPMVEFRQFTDGCWDASYEKLRPKPWYRKIKMRDLIFLVILLIPLWMFLAWYFTPLKPINIFILDKTVPNLQYEEHRSLIWLLRHFRFAFEDRLYRADNDYYGFHPSEPGKSYRIYDLEDFSSKALEEMARRYDMAWIADTYGVYKNDWEAGDLLQERNPLIYGRLSKEEADFLEIMAEQKKLIIAEFNFIGTPTSWRVRRQMEKRFGFRWSGWTGRHFDSLDSTNYDLPRWVIHNYTEQYDTTWHFHNSGIVLTHTSEQIAVLELYNHLTRDRPDVITSMVGSRDFPKLPTQLDYPFWFDICSHDTSNQTIAYYEISTSSRGDSLLSALNIPKLFPAVFRSKDSLFYYFAGDVSDTRVKNVLAYFKGIHTVRGFFYKAGDSTDRDRFFWEFSYPITKAILENYQQSLSAKKISFSD
jgi:hypothetical protein